jgi:tripeptidyl-peptidase-1
MFGTFKKFKSTIHSISEVDASSSSQSGSLEDPVTGVTVDASCNTTITVTCLKELYNAVGYTASSKVGNSIAITGYLEENANRADLQTFFEDQVPAAAAVNSTFNFISVAGILFFYLYRASGLKSSQGVLIPRMRHLPAAKPTSTYNSPLA